jgi:AcrR family transcriptional regulator
MSPRSKVLNDQLRQESRAKIVHHALMLFSRRGFDRTSMSAVAKAAGVSPGLIYHYFDSKEALLREIFLESMADVRASFAEAEAAGWPEERLERLVRASFDLVRRKLPFWRLSYGVRMQPAALAALGEELPQWTQLIRRKLEGYLRDAGAPDPELEAEILFALIDGVAQHYTLEPERYPLAEVTERIVAAYQHLIS